MESKRGGVRGEQLGASGCVQQQQGESPEACRMKVSGAGQ